MSVIMSLFEPLSRPVLIGSVPMTDHLEAVRLIRRYTPEIPLWPQLPVYKTEGMLLQFLPGMPGVREHEDRVFVDTEAPEFEMEFLSFFEDYLMVTEGAGELDASRFAMKAPEANGLLAFLQFFREHQDGIVALKGQVTGPVTFCTTLVDREGRALFYNEQLRDAAVKLLALKARWQARKLAEVKACPIVFFDEPGLAGFGSSAFITITPEDINTCLSEVYEGVRAEGGLTGVHVCANTEWSVIFDSGVDIVSFDSFSYFDKMLLYPDHVRAFFARGGLLALGIVPTDPAFIETSDVDGLFRKWEYQVGELEKIGIDREVVFRQSFITPSCGTGTATEAQTLKVLELTRDLSARVRSRFG